MLNQTHPHFIRCIIPNEKKQCGLIGGIKIKDFIFWCFVRKCHINLFLDASLVLNQLTCKRY